jgi:hypothetical protein
VFVKIENIDEYDREKDVMKGYFVSAREEISNFRFHLFTLSAHETQLNAFFCGAASQVLVT